VLGAWAKEQHDDQRARAWFARACDLGVPRGCSFAGVLHLQASPVADESQGTSLLARGCDQGDMFGCANLGGWYATRMPPDDLRARPRLEAGCRADLAQACVGLAAVVRRDPTEPSAAQVADALYRRGCDLGHGYTCTWLGSLVVNGRQGYTKDPAAALLLFEQGCRAGDGDGCAFIGLDYWNGLSRPRDKVRALAMLEQACSLDSAMGCQMLANVLTDGGGSTSATARAMQASERAEQIWADLCRRGNQTGCRQSKGATGPPPPRWTP
jgi:uncharacterized protein